MKWRISVLITLPISIRGDGPLGYWLTPVIVDALAKRYHEPSTIFYGDIGRRRVDMSRVLEFETDLAFLATQVPLSADSAYQEKLISSVRRCLEVGRVVQKDSECFVCECGCLELPVSIARYARQKTFIRADETYVCRVCNSTGVPRCISQSVYYFNSKCTEILDSIRIVPGWYEGELQDLAKQIDESGIVIGRIRDTGIVLDGMNLDSDFLWQQLVSAVSASDSDTFRIVLTNHVLRQALLTALFAKTIDPAKHIELIILPCIVHPGKIEKWTLQCLREKGYSGEQLRTMLVGSLRWNVKDSLLYDEPSNIEHRRLNLLKHRVTEVQALEAKCQASENLTKALCHQSIVSGIKHVFNPNQFEYRDLIGLF